MHKIDTADQEFIEMIKFVKEMGISVKTNTRARGHQGFFMNGRIDISSVLTLQRKKQVLVHEFAHFVHTLVEPDVMKTHGSLERLFMTDNTDIIEQELFEVTYGSGKIPALEKISALKKTVTENIKALDKKIKLKYPEFKRSEAFTPIERVIKKTDAKYLLKYDRVNLKGAWGLPDKLFSVHDIEKNFPQFEPEITDYIRLKSQQRYLRRLSSRASRLNRYFKRPSELFARFIEELYTNPKSVKTIAPVTLSKYKSLLAERHYPYLKEFSQKFFCNNIH